jgi:hypothetical protein
MGFERGLVFTKILYMLGEHEAHGKNNFVDKVWYYTSYKDMACWIKDENDQPILSLDTVRRALEYLVSEGWLIKHAKGFNAIGYDKTSWYTYGSKCLESGLFTDKAKMPYGQGVNALPIPYTKVNTNSLKETTASKKKTEELKKQNRLEIFN